MLKLRYLCSRIAAIPPEVLETYKDMISDTTSDLDTHLKDLQEKIDRLQAGDVTAVDDIATEWHAMLQEKEITQQGLRMCAELSAQIVDGIYRTHQLLRPSISAEACSVRVGRSQRLHPNSCIAFADA